MGYITRSLNIAGRYIFSKKHPYQFVVLDNGWGLELTSDPHFVTMYLPNQSSANQAFSTNLLSTNYYAGFLIDAVSGIRLKNVVIGDQVQIVNLDHDRISKEFFVTASYSKPTKFRARDIIELSNHTFGKSKNISGKGETQVQTQVLIGIIVMADLHNANNATESEVYSYFCKYNGKNDKASFNTAMNRIKDSGLVDINIDGKLVITSELIYLAMNAVNKSNPNNPPFPTN